MADEIIISIATKVAEYLVEPTLRQGQYLLCVSKFLKNLENKKKELMSTRDGVRRRVEEAKKKTEKIEDSVEKWLGEVTNLLEEVENLEQELKENTNCFQGWCPNWRRYHLCKQMAKKTKMITELNNNSKFEPFSHLASLPNIEYFSSGNFTFFESTKLAYNQLLEALQDDSTYMVGLYGMGGSGKTTLVKEVGKRAKELKHFDKVVFTTLSQTPNVMRIQDEIAEWLDLRLDEKSEVGRGRRISLRLQSGERILIILDDVWTKINLENIGIPFDSNLKSFKVLLTTRRQQVCALMDCQIKIPLGLLSEEESWTLLQKHAGIDNEFCNLHEVAQEVAGECKGLPIAIGAVGTSLKGKSIDEWKVALKRLRDSKPIDVEEGVRDAFTCLKLSYDYLRSREAKSLLVMCSMFQENHDIFIEDLFRYGIGLGLCGEVSSFEVARIQVNAVINNLIDSCLLMHSEKINHLKMHDMIRDVALWIATLEDCPIVVNPATNLNALAEDEAIKGCYALSSWYKNIDRFPNQLDAPKLKILLLDTASSLEFSHTSFEGMKSLEVVAMIAQNYYMGRFTSLLRSTQFLSNLRTLRLVRWELGDISLVVSLRRLEILDLRGSCFKELPNGIEKLNKLKLLDLSWCRIEESCYKVIRRCSQLQELYVLGNCFDSGVLDAYECYIDDVTFPKLERFVLQIGRFKSDVSLDLDDLSTRVLHVGQLNLSTSGAVIKYLLQRAGDVSLYKLLGGCKSVIPCMVQAVGGMKDLTKLLLHSCSEIECLIDTTSNDADLFQSNDMSPRLVKLELESMRNLEQLCRGPPLPCMFDKLEELHIWLCRQLQSISSGEWNLCNLKILRIQNCPKLTSLFPISVARTLLLLQELTIEKCSELKHIIINAEDGTNTGEEISPVSDNSPLMFPKLKILSVSSCHKMEYVFPISCVQSLEQLQYLSIVQASEMKYVFGQHDYGDNLSTENKIEIQFPLLEVLELQDLTNLLRIFPENYLSSFPSLRNVYCIDCPEFTYFGQLDPYMGVNNHDEDQLGIMRLQNIHVLRCIWTDAHPLQILSFQLLQCLEVYHSKSLKYAFSADVHRYLSELRHIIIFDCEELEGITEENEEPGSQVCFPKLKELKVVACNKLKSLFPATTAIILPQLNSLYIEEAAQLEEVFRHKCEDDNNRRKEIVLPNLREIKLKNLPSLVDLCQGFKLHTLELYKVLIHECPKFGPILGATPVVSHCQRTEELQAHVINVGQVSNEVSDLQAASNKIKQLPIHEEKEIMTSIVEWLYLKHLPDLSFLWISFQNIYFLQVSGCRKLKSIFSTTVIRSLPRLNILEIEDCEELEEIISDPDFEEQSFGNPSSNTHSQIVCFPNLTYLKVQRCSKLKSVFSVTKSASDETHDGEVIQFVLPKLKELTLKKLPSLTDICGSLQFQFQLQLQALELYELKHCPNFSSATVATLDNFWHARQSHSTDDETEEEDYDSDYFDEDDSEDDEEEGGEEDE